MEHPNEDAGQTLPGALRSPQLHPTHPVAIDTTELAAAEDPASISTAAQQEILNDVLAIDINAPRPHPRKLPANAGLASLLVRLSRPRRESVGLSTQGVLDPPHGVAVGTPTSPTASSDTYSFSRVTRFDADTEDDDGSDDTTSPNVHSTRSFRRRSRVLAAATSPANALPDEMELAQRPRTCFILSLPVDVLRYTIDNYISVRYHYRLRLISTVFNALVCANCYYWQRRLVDYYANPSEEIQNCGLLQRLSRADLSSPVTERSPVRSPRPMRRESTASPTREATGGFPIALCFRGCAYRLWRQRNIYRDEQDQHKTHRQELRAILGSPAAWVVLAPECCTFATGVSASIVCAAVITMTMVVEYIGTSASPHLAIIPIWVIVVALPFLGRSVTVGARTSTRLAALILYCGVMSSIVLMFYVKIWPSSTVKGGMSWTVCAVPLLVVVVCCACQTAFEGFTSLFEDAPLISPPQLTVDWIARKANEAPTAANHAGASWEGNSPRRYRQPSAVSLDAVDVHAQIADVSSEGTAPSQHGAVQDAGTSITAPPATATADGPLEGREAAPTLSERTGIHKNAVCTYFFRCVYLLGGCSKYVRRTPFLSSYEKDHKARRQRLLWFVRLTDMLPPLLCLFALIAFVVEHEESPPPVCALLGPTPIFLVLACVIPAVRLTAANCALYRKVVKRNAAFGFLLLGYALTFLVLAAVVITVFIPYRTVTYEATSLPVLQNLPGTLGLPPGETLAAPTDPTTAAVLYIDKAHCGPITYRDAEAKTSTVCFMVGALAALHWVLLVANVITDRTTYCFTRLLVYETYFPTLRACLHTVLPFATDEDLTPVVEK